MRGGGCKQQGNTRMRCESVVGGDVKDPHSGSADVVAERKQVQAYLCVSGLEGGKGEEEMRIRCESVVWFNLMHKLIMAANLSLRHDMWQQCRHQTC